MRPALLIAAAAVAAAAAGDVPAYVNYAIYGLFKGAQACAVALGTSPVAVNGEYPGLSATERARNTYCALVVCEMRALKTDLAAGIPHGQGKRRRSIWRNVRAGARNCALLVDSPAARDVLWNICMTLDYMHKDVRRAERYNDDRRWKIDKRLLAEVLRLYDTAQDKMPGTFVPLRRMLPSDRKLPAAAAVGLDVGDDPSDEYTAESSSSSEDGLDLSFPRPYVIPISRKNRRATLPVDLCFDTTAFHRASVFGCGICYETVGLEGVEFVRQKSMVPETQRGDTSLGFRRVNCGCQFLAHIACLKRAFADRVACPSCKMSLAHLEHEA